MADYFHYDADVRTWISDFSAVFMGAVSSGELLPDEKEAIYVNDGLIVEMGGWKRNYDVFSATS